MDEGLQRSITYALDRTESGVWQPRHTIDHNDFWLNNVMLPAQDQAKTRQKYPFILIDWSGANPYGYGIYDLFRIARSLKLSDKAAL